MAKNAKLTSYMMACSKVINALFEMSPKSVIPITLDTPELFTGAMTSPPCNWFGQIKKTSGHGRLISTTNGFGASRCWSIGLTKKQKAIGISTSQEISQFSQQIES